MSSEESGGEAERGSARPERSGGDTRPERSECPGSIGNFSPAPANGRSADERGSRSAGERAQARGRNGARKHERRAPHDANETSEGRAAGGRGGGAFHVKQFTNVNSQM